MLIVDLLELGDSVLQQLQAKQCLNRDLFIYNETRAFQAHSPKMHDQYSKPSMVSIHVNDNSASKFQRAGKRQINHTGKFNQRRWQDFIGTLLQLIASSLIHSEKYDECWLLSSLQTKTIFYRELMLGGTSTGH